MPTELEELVGFIGHPNPQIRALAIENLVPYSLTDPAIFKADSLRPVRNLKILIRDNPAISEHAATVLINLSGDQEVLDNLVKDDVFVNDLLSRITKPDEHNANLLAMLLANLAKWDGIKSILEKKQDPPPSLASDELVINQLVDLFVKGFDGTYNPKADYDYLAYLFADLAKHPEIRRHFVTRQSYDNEFPLTKMKVFTEHKSDIRRRGVASTIKNVSFEIPSHKSFLHDEEINILPYILLPITGNEEYTMDESMDMLPDLQLLPPDKQRDSDPTIIQTHVETLTILTTTRAGRDRMREVNVYPIIRETHLRTDHEGVQDACDRLVQVLMADEAEEDTGTGSSEAKVEELEDNEEDELVEV